MTQDIWKRTLTQTGVAIPLHVKAPRAGSSKIGTTSFTKGQSCETLKWRRRVPRRSDDDSRRNTLANASGIHGQCLTLNDAESTEGLIGLQNIMSATETAYLNYLWNPTPVTKTLSEPANFTYSKIQQAGSERSSS